MYETILQAADTPAAVVQRLFRLIDYLDDIPTVTIKDLTLRHANYPGGGAIYIMEGNLTLDHCYITANSAETGGAIFTDVGNLTLKNCIVENNRAK